MWVNATAQTPGHGSRGSVEVDRIPELQTEPDSVLIRVGLARRRRGAGALLKQRVPSKEAHITSELIGHAEGQCDRLDVDAVGDRKSTRLNSSHRCISYAV